MREREFVAQRGDLFAQPLVVLERRSEPDADRFVACALTRWQPRRRPAGGRVGARWWPRCRSMSARRPGWL
jgi:hypothetical protein